MDYNEFNIFITCVISLSLNTEDYKKKVDNIPDTRQPKTELANSLETKVTRKWSKIFSFLVFARGITI